MEEDYGREEEEVSVLEHATNCYENYCYMVEITRHGALTFEGEFTFAECIADGIEQLCFLTDLLIEAADLIDSEQLYDKRSK